jgi:hypothetical protein
MRNYDRFPYHYWLIAIIAYALALTAVIISLTKAKL